MNNFTVTVTAIIYNEENELLLGYRNPNDQNSPGIFTYIGGKTEYNNKEEVNGTITNILENTLKREVKEEINLDIDNISYLTSHAFTKENGDKVIVVTYIAKCLDKTKIKPDKVDITDYKWIKKPSDLDSLKSLDIVKTIYKKAFTAIEELKYHNHVEVAGLIINENGEFLVMKESDSGMYVFPHGLVENLPGRTWEILEKNLMRNVYMQTNIELADGMIPFTDREFIGKDGFEKIIQFFICRYSRGTAQSNDPFKFSEVKWIQFESMTENEFKPLVYSVYKKANEFIKNINN